MKVNNIPNKRKLVKAMGGTISIGSIAYNSSKPQNYIKDGDNMNAFHVNNDSKMENLELHNI